MATWHEAYKEHLRSGYWRDVKRALRRRVYKAHGKLCCERCGSEDGPFDCHHTTEAYRFLGRELEVLDLMRFWCRACHDHRHGRGPDPMHVPTIQELMKQIEEM